MIILAEEKVCPLQDSQHKISCVAPHENRKSIFIDHFLESPVRSSPRGTAKTERSGPRKQLIERRGNRSRRGRTRPCVHGSPDGRRRTSNERDRLGLHSRFPPSRMYPVGTPYVLRVTFVPPPLRSRRFSSFCFRHRNPGTLLKLLVSFSFLRRRPPLSMD